MPKESTPTPTEVINKDPNIFSWKEIFRGKNMTPQERVDFYYGKLKEGYQESVLEAEIARQEARKPDDPADQKVANLFEGWASPTVQQRLNVALERRKRKGLDVGMGKETVNLGLAGHFRIEEVHETTMAGKIPPKKKKEREKRLATAEEVFQRWPSVEETTLTTPHTIHGGPINWALEVAQDKAKYLLRAEKQDEAASETEEGISLAFQEINRWLLQNLPNQPKIVAADIDLYLKEIKPKVEEEKFQELIGLLSAEAVLLYQKGLATKRLAPLVGALRDISAVQEVAPNNHRFATINWKVLRGAFFYKGKFSLRKRLGYLGKAAANLWKTGREDPKAVTRSFLQMF